MGFGVFVGRGPFGSLRAGGKVGMGVAFASDGGGTSFATTVFGPQDGEAAAAIIAPTAAQALQSPFCTGRGYRKKVVGGRW